MASLSQKPKGHEGFLRNHLFTSSPLQYLSLISAAMCSPLARTLHNTLPCDQTLHSSFRLVCLETMVKKNVYYYYYYLWIHCSVFRWSDNFLETTESIFKYSKSLHLYQHISSVNTCLVTSLFGNKHIYIYIVFCRKLHNFIK